MWLQVQSAGVTHLAEASCRIELHKFQRAGGGAGNDAAILVSAGQLGCQAHDLLQGVPCACTHQAVSSYQLTHAGGDVQAGHCSS